MLGRLVSIFAYSDSRQFGQCQDSHSTRRHDSTLPGGGNKVKLKKGTFSLTPRFTACKMPHVPVPVKLPSTSRYESRSHTLFLTVSIAFSRDRNEFHHHQHRHSQAKPTIPVPPRVIHHDHLQTSSLVWGEEGPHRRIPQTLIRPLRSPVSRVPVVSHRPLQISVGRTGLQIVVS